MGAPQWFTLRYGAFSGFALKLVGSGPEHSGIAVSDADLAIKMGRSFDGRAPRTSVTSARALTDTVISRGVHGWRGDWLVNGAGDRARRAPVRAADAEPRAVVPGAGCDGSGSPSTIPTGSSPQWERPARV